MFSSFVLLTETPQFDQQFDTMLVRAGESVSLLCNSSSGDQPIRHRWVKDQRPLTSNSIFYVSDDFHSSPNSNGFLSSQLNSMITNDAAGHFRLQCETAQCESGAVRLHLLSASQSDSGL